MMDETSDEVAMDAMINESPRPPVRHMPVQIAKAMLAVMKGAKQLGFDEKNEHGKYQYVSIDKFLEAFRPLLAEAGLMLIVDEVSSEARTGGGERQTTWLFTAYDVWLVHYSGTMWGPLRRHLALPLTGPQAFGSSESYVQKRLLRTLFMVPTGDKDADEVAPTDSAPRATRANPAVGGPQNTQAALARDRVRRLRDDIANAATIEQLNEWGIMGKHGDDDRELICAQPQGAAVWQDLVGRDAAKRLYLSQG